MMPDFSGVVQEIFVPIAFPFPVPGEVQRQLIACLNQVCRRGLRILPGCGLHSHNDSAVQMVHGEAIKRFGEDILDLV